ncbi:MAG: MFS transporter [Candidatus Dactylopiibacterium carminicum]|uniref:MFS transporter n=1 Tax=Candidatus Dactylopiibacterium carminicum TaxID=857335 RepID=A0A272EPQ8_9RHOO|nr:MFS transporter [Candidatus Dactylopiibacterium carminicum]KAF7598498.1 MFS transporter [Candidatus Dactylopiibacterium carminicum]PAS92093.1 MAG: MFS transporter [Candidatus Dactylopiibacterium carminicum]PAS97897.1 MAG: MFS transporter [Candidatus Dactylopiibacterium carminicum]
MQAVTHWAQRRLGAHFHYAWVAVALAFLIMLITAGTRATPSVMMVALEESLGWDRISISLALSINLALFGLVGPFAAAAMERFGLRRTVLVALFVLAVAVALSNWMQQRWQMSLLWGVLVGSATGVTAMTFGATVVNRWFKTRRGLAMGLLTASSATGQLVFLPFLASLVESSGWRPVVLSVAAAIAVAIPFVFLLLPERPAQVGLALYGEPEGTPPAPVEARRNPVALAFSVLGRAVKERDFWLLFFSFFVCGATTNGYIGTHFIAMCGDYGLDPVKGASVLAAMGALDLVGTTASGWLSDRFNNRVLLFWYYGLRGLALLYLPAAFGLGYFGLPVFAVFYGLDWIATVPPTVRLTTDVFGSRDAPIVFGWIVTGHQLGAAFSALLGGVLRANLGTYTLATMFSGVLCLLAAVMVLRINRQGRLAPAG